MLEKAGIDVKVARKECLPSINLGGLVLFNAQNIGSLFNSNTALWGLGGGLLHPVFAGGRLRANLKSKKIAYEKSLRNYEKVNLTSMQEVNDTLVSVNLDKERLAKQKEIQDLEKAIWYIKDRINQITNARRIVRFTPAGYDEHPSGVECGNIAQYYCESIRMAINFLWCCGLETNISFINPTIESGRLLKAINNIEDRINQLKGEK
jgi:hypothetical protein